MKWYFVALLAHIGAVGSVNDTHTYWDIVAPGASIGLELSSNLMVLGFIGSKESSSSSLRQSVEVGDELVAVNGAVRTSHFHMCPLKICLIMLSSPPGCCRQEFAHCFIPHKLFGASKNATVQTCSSVSIAAKEWPTGLHCH
jgi:hypothetical protein